MGSTEQLLALIPAIYDAALDPALWGSVVQRCADFLSSHCGMLARQSISENSGASITYGFDPEAMAQYFTYYAARNNFMRRAIMVPPGTVECDRDVMPRDEFERSEFYNDFLKKQLDADAILTSLLWRDQNDVVAFTLCRGTRRPEFENEDKQVLATLMPHMGRALHMSLRLGTLQTQSDRTRELLDKSAHGVLVVDAKGKVLLANARAEIILRRNDGICAGADGVRGVSQSVTDRLRGAIARAVNGDDGGAIALPQARSGETLYALVTPCSPEQGWLHVPEPRALILLREADARPVLRADYLQSIFDLSPAEARVAVKLYQGLDLTQAAQALSISRNTARVHLNAILSKTGTHRQAELMRRLTGIADLCAAAAPREY